MIEAPAASSRFRAIATMNPLLAYAHSRAFETGFGAAGTTIPES
jgi:hypothetical protein